jgi:chloride channel 7
LVVDAQGKNVGEEAVLPTSYNELATLMSVTGEDAIKHLMQRRTHLQFGFASVFTMLVVYFTFACIAAGTAPSAGLFVPMLLMGSCAGRLVRPSPRRRFCSCYIEMG